MKENFDNTCNKKQLLFGPIFKNHYSKGSTIRLHFLSTHNQINNSMKQTNNIKKQLHRQKRVNFKTKGLCGTNMTDKPCAHARLLGGICCRHPPTTADHH